MKRTNKIYEAIAIVSQLQMNLTTHGLNGLKFDANTRALLRPNVKAAYDALERLTETLDKCLEDETGLTEKQKWVNAARNLGVAK
jgi:hypothetical protein